LIFGEDGELFFRALTSAPRVVFAHGALTLYRLHNVNKLTQDEGASRARRVKDWARCLHYMIERCKNCRLEMDFLTRSIFLAGIRKHLRYMQKTPDMPGEMIAYLSGYTKQMPDAWLLSVSLWLRVAEQFRLRLRGSRWMPGYQAGPVTETQRALIHQLGFQLS
jgi:hypothetical protein